mgnify:CR=1 FL=1
MQEQYENQEEGQIDLLEIIHVMLRKWWLIVLCGIIGAGALGVYTKFGFLDNLYFIKYDECIWERNQSVFE